MSNFEAVMFFGVVLSSLFFTKKPEDKESKSIAADETRVRHTSERTKSNSSENIGILKSYMANNHSKGNNLENEYGVEVLMHNISHADLVCSINDDTSSVPTDNVIARPKFSHYREISELILCKLRTEGYYQADDNVVALHDKSVEVSYHPVFTRQHENIRYPINDAQENFSLPVGFNFSRDKILVPDSAVLR